MTPAEVWDTAAAVYEHEVEMMKYQSWLTASLTGANKVPPFDKCFPTHQERRPQQKVNIGAIFASAGHMVVRAND